MSYYNNLANDSTNEIEKKDIEKDEIEKIEIEKKIFDKICIFGDFFGLVPKEFVKYFNLFAFQLSCVILFTLIYRILMIDFDTNYFVPRDFEREHFTNHKLLIAFFMSINFQSTTAYVDLKCRSVIARLSIILQIISTFAITFMFFI
jgi:hypothetical protein